MRRVAWIAALAILLSAAPAAGAQGTSQISLFGFGTGTASVTDVSGQLAGALTISFHGDPATGCAAQGLCGYSGTVLVRPGPGVDIGVGKSRGANPSYQAEMSLAGGPVGALTAAHVTRAGGGLCGDAQHPFVALPASIRGGVVSLPFLQPGGMLLSTRCAGPLDGDLAGLGPRITLPLRELLSGRAAIDLSGSWSFAAGGFAGTLDSTLKLTLGKPLTEKTQLSVPKGVKSRLTRQVDETLTITHADGGVNMALGSDSSTCEFVDSCGLSGSTTATMDPSAGVGSLTVLGPASRPYRDFLAALGLTRHGNPRGLAVIGSISWAAGGTASSSLNPGTPCTSQAPLGGGAVLLSEQPGGFSATYVPASSIRTRCPGPALSQFATLASGSIQLKQLRRQSFTLRMSGSGPLTDDGYTITQRTSLAFTVKRGGLRQQTYRQPAP